MENNQPENCRSGNRSCQETAANTGGQTQRQLYNSDTYGVAKLTNSNKIVMAASTATATLAAQLTINEQIILGTFLELMGGNLLTIAALDQINLQRMNRTTITEPIDEEFTI